MLLFYVKKLSFYIRMQHFYVKKLSFLQNIYLQKARFFSRKKDASLRKRTAFLQMYICKKAVRLLKNFVF